MKRVAVGLSGGVDSSVCAWLLKKQGYDVVGITMQNFDPADPGDHAGDGSAAIDDARAVADYLGIRHEIVRAEEAFKANVIDYFIAEYQHGRTPNPCIVCNRFVKWESILKRSEELGIDCLATGHYAQVVSLDNGRYSLRVAAGDEYTSKDQTYALCRLTQEQLKRTLMPLGDYTKEEVRQFAKEAGIPVADKPDSEDICFVPDRDYAGFICRRTGREPLPGHFVDQEGHVLGTHKGIIHYTVGQRKHLGIALGRPVFVREIRPDTNEVVLSDNASLMSPEVIVRDLNWMAVEALHEPVKVSAKIRYNHKASPAVIEDLGQGLVRCLFDEPQRAATPGQAAVFYKNGIIIGGGTIV